MYVILKALKFITPNYVTLLVSMCVWNHLCWNVTDV